ncbi:hypothetical protein DMJ13_21385 [halophilic archaeon]|nr:hypothetical protein DMJ13_21385 [halophilic archaeon]
MAARFEYFETPSREALDEIGEELGISSQAISKRIRGGIEKLVHKRTVFNRLSTPSRPGDRS